MSWSGWVLFVVLLYVAARLNNYANNQTKERIKKQKIDRIKNNIMIGRFSDRTYQESLDSLNSILAIAKHINVSETYNMIETMDYIRKFGISNRELIELGKEILEKQKVS